MRCVAIYQGDMFMDHKEIDYEYEDAAAIEIRGAQTRTSGGGGWFGKIVALFLGIVIGA